MDRLRSERDTAGQRSASPIITVRPRISRAALLLGIALGGFFDGILLHQVLQWHHLMLGIQSGPFADLRVQLLADGLFHLLMYVLALIGAYALWRSRHDPDPLSGTELLSSLLLGFGAWHVLDAVLSHWILGIHRIRMDTSNPLLWDVLWLMVFGGGAILAAYSVRRRGARPGPKPPNRVMASIVALVLSASIVAAIPPRAGEQVAVLVDPRQVIRLLEGVRLAGGGILWADRSGALWVFRLDDDASAALLYQHGALLVTRSPAALGCLAWARRPD